MSQRPSSQRTYEEEIAFLNKKFERGYITRNELKQYIAYAKLKHGKLDKK